MKYSLKNISRLTILLALLIFLLVVARSVFIPVVFSIILTLGLIPVCNFLERLGVNRLFSIIFTYIGLVLFFGGLLLVISLTFSNIYQELPQIQGKIEEGLKTLGDFVNRNVGWTDAAIKERLEDNASNILQTLWSFVGASISSSLATIAGISLTLIYTFCLLLYRRGIKEILLSGASNEQREDRKALMKKVQQLIQSYLYGILLLILILGTLNSIGLWLIGIDYAFFWGYLAAALIIIPYIGTTLGGIFPFLYALATTSTVWQPVAVVLMYFGIQQVDGSFITPNVLGSKMNVNPMIVIFAMFLGGFAWGIVGIILVVPITGVMHTVFMHYEKTRPLGKLMGKGLR